MLRKQRTDDMSMSSSSTTLSIIRVGYVLHMFPYAQEHIVSTSTDTAYYSMSVKRVKMVLL